MCIWSTTVGRRRELWEHLCSIKHASLGVPWACIGNFNAYTCKQDKFGGAEANWAAMKDFNDCMDECGLTDLGFSGPKYTWSNGHVQERLDRCIVNAAWLSMHENSCLLHLILINSNRTTDLCS